MSCLPSRNAIDKAGKQLSKNEDLSESARREQEAIVDHYRQGHLMPLTSLTSQLQEWMADFGGDFYIAQRLKRKPQIVRKLRRLSVRLTQLQDVGGARIVVKTNADVDRLQAFLRRQIESPDGQRLLRVADYRQKGRDESGYRALHFVLREDLFHIELQLRSEAQHYWAEQIERTSVIYGYHLKELEGDGSVIEYFRVLSDIFYELESGREPSPEQKLLLDITRGDAEVVIRSSDRRNVFDSRVNEGVVKAMIARQARHPGRISNWIIVFDWNTGSFVSWHLVDRNPDLAMKAYVEQEQLFSADDGYEVVMIGSSEPSMVRHTHSHYFGIESYEEVLSTLEGSIAGLSRRLPIGIGERQILQTMVRRKYWSDTKAVKRETLKNHYCRSVVGFDEAMSELFRRAFVRSRGVNGPVFLNIDEKANIESCVG